MRFLIRLLLALGLLCLAVNPVRGVISYYSTLGQLTDDPDSAVDALASRAAQMQHDLWPSPGWAMAGFTLIAAAIGLAVTRSKGRRKRPVH